MDIFSFKSYKIYILSYVKSLPKQGRGELSKIASALNIHNTTLSQVLKGDKNINLEQALELSNYLCLNTQETDFFLLLVNYERAGTHKLKSYLETQIEQIAQKVYTKVSFKKSPEKEFSDEVKSKFYSSWAYSGIRVLSSIPSYQSLDAISTYLRIPKKRAKSILDFLVKNELCVKKADKYNPGPVHTHISSEDTFINAHRINWRAKAIERMAMMDETEFAFSAPMSLSKKDFLHIRSELNKLVQNCVDTAKNSTPEVTACLNLDWIKF